MRTAQDVIVRPYITEKSSMDMSEGKYTFIVATNSTKTEIRKAVEELFSVKVLKVNTVNYMGKVKRMGVHKGPRANWKKAVVKIDLDPKPVTYFEKGAKQVVSGKKFKTTIEEFGASQ